MEIMAPAKINMFLKITGKRPDGYHEIETIFLPLKAPVDRISISDSSKNESRPIITSNDPTLPLGEENLCFKAAASFAESANVAPAWKIHIEKNIPVAAGLGGGSSDAGAVLKKLNEMPPGVNSDALHEIAVSLGADVPFFLESRPAIARGIGDVLTPLSDIPEIPLLVVNPGFPVSAAWGFQNYVPADEASLETAVEVLKQGNFDKLAEVCCNDLQTAVFNKFPIMGLLKESLLRLGVKFALMSGSGPTLFAVCESGKEAEDIARQISKKYADAVYCIATSTT